MIDMTLEMQEAMESRLVRTCLFYGIDHPEAPLGFWNGIGTKAWDGKAWTGGGTLLAFSGVKSDGQIAVQDISVSLSGIDPTGLDLTDAKVRGLQSSLWFGLLRADQSVIPDPVLLRQMTLDNLSYKLNDDGTATLAVVGQSYLWATNKPTRLAWTPEEHKRKYPEDTGFDLVHTFATKKTAWRRT